MIDVLTCRGTGEVCGAPDNMLTTITASLDPARFRTGPDIDYPATIGPANSAGNPLGCSEDVSIARGVALLAAAIRGTPNVVGLLGYSLGALVVSRFLECKAHGQYADCEIAWAGFVANPARAAGESIDAAPVGYGINGAHARWPRLPVFTAANPADGITSCPAGSPLRNLATGMSAFSFAALGGWTESLVQELADREFAPPDLAHPVVDVELDLNAASLMRGYLFDGQHTHTYRDEGYCQRLADVINRVR